MEHLHTLEDPIFQVGNLDLIRIGNLGEGKATHGTRVVHFLGAKNEGASSHRQASLALLGARLGRGECGARREPA